MIKQWSNFWIDIIGIGIEYETVSSLFIYLNVRTRTEIYSVNVSYKLHNQVK